MKTMEQIKISKSLQSFFEGLKTNINSITNEPKPFEVGKKVKAIKSNIWHNSIRQGKEGVIVKITEFGCNVFFPISEIMNYQDQIFFCEFNQIELI